MSTIIETPLTPNPFRPLARRNFRFCVPDEWYRRSKSRIMPSISVVPSESTLKQAAIWDTSNEDESSEGEGTAKVKITQRPSNERRDSPDWRSSLSQVRLSSLFEGWGGTAASQLPKRASFSPERVSVSEPKLVQHFTGGNLLDLGNEAPESAEPDNAEFEAVLVRMFFSCTSYLLLNRCHRTNLA